MLLLNLHGGEEEKAFQQLFFQKSFSGYVLFYFRVVSVDSRVKVKGSIVGILASCFLCCGISKRNTDANES